MKSIQITSLGIIATLALIIGLNPAHASAATVYVESSRSTISVGDTAVVAIRVSADGAVLNTVDGEVSISHTSGDAKVTEFSLANSSFGLWPRTPSLSTDGHTVSFVGGVPGGFSIEGATLFKIIVQATKQGTITIRPQNMSVFANDGNGTKIPPQLKDFTLTVVPAKTGSIAINDWSNTVATDTVPPAPFIIVPGQDQSLFAGKKFAFFSAVDNQSGIDHYDVSENGGPAVRSGSMYVFQDQSGNAVLNVVAYDKAGNKTIAMYPAASTGNGIAWSSIIVVVLVLVVIYFIYKVLRAKSKKNKNVPTV